MNIIRATWGFKSLESPNVTPDRPQFDDHIRSAIAQVARGLSASDPRSHVFFEERWDSRTTLASTGLREVVSTRTRGATVAGRRSVHVTEPEFIEVVRRMPEDADAVIGASRLEHMNWVASLEARIVESATAACNGLGHPLWSARLVSFHQDVWVGQPAGDVNQEARMGCRLEIRVQMGSESSSSFGIQELVLHHLAGSPPITEGFVRALERAERRVGIAPAPEPGSTTAVFAPGVGGIVVHELIGHALEGDVVSRGPTWISDAGFLESVPPVTVVDDPRRGRGAWKIDDEGVGTGETLLLERGRPVGLLLDKASAHAVGRASTGHGRRSSYLEAVRPRMGCTFISAGIDDPEEVLRSTRTGVFIRRLVGGHTDPSSGAATFIVSDSDRIIDGRLAEPLDRFVLELDGPRSWSSIDRVAHDLAFDTCIGSCVREGQPMAVSVGAPTIRIGVVRVAS
jgi:hypothetical protein